MGGDQALFEVWKKLGQFSLTSNDQLEHVLEASTSAMRATTQKMAKSQQVHLFCYCKVQIFWEGHKIWKKLPPLLEFTFQNFVAFSEYLNFTYRYRWNDVLFLFNTNFSGVLSFRCLGQAHKTLEVSFTITKYQFTILRFLSLLLKIMGDDIHMIIWHKFYEYSEFSISKKKLTFKMKNQFRAKLLFLWKFSLMRSLAFSIIYYGT